MQCRTNKVANTIDSQATLICTKHVKPIKLLCFHPDAILEVRSAGLFNVPGRSSHDYSTHITRERTKISHRGTQQDMARDLGAETFSFESGDTLKEKSDPDHIETSVREENSNNSNLKNRGTEDNNLTSSISWDDLLDDAKDDLLDGAKDDLLDGLDDSF